MFGAPASVTLSRSLVVQERTAVFRAGFTVLGRPLTRLYEAMTPVAASAAMAGLNAAWSYSRSTRGRRLEEVVSRCTSLLLAR